MPPARSRALLEDSRGDMHAHKERSATSAATVTKSRRAGAAPPTIPSKDAASLTGYNPAAGASSSLQTSLQTSQPGISWTAEDASLLHSYRTAYRLDVAPSFRSPLSAAVLTVPSIGRNSPTMAKRKEKTRVQKEQLALAVRKHFNGLAVNESDVVVDFLYAVKSQDRNFKMRFAPPRHR